MGQESTSGRALVWMLEVTANSPYLEAYRGKETNHPGTRCARGGHVPSVPYGLCERSPALRPEGWE